MAAEVPSGRVGVDGERGRFSGFGVSIGYRGGCSFGGSIRFADGSNGGDMTRDGTARRTAAPGRLSPVVALLALAVMLVGIFATLSQATGHDMHATVPSSSAAASSLEEAAGLPAVAVVAPAAVLMSSGAHDGSLDCGLLALACVLFLTLVALVVVARRIAVYRQHLDAGGVSLGLKRAVVLPIHRPSLTLLSICRV